DGLLQHPLLVVDDDLGRAEVDQSLEAVVAVDDTTVQVVEVRGGETTTVELDHRTQLRRDDRDRVEHHAARVVAGGLERGDDLQSLQGTQLLLALTGADGLAQRLGLSVDVELAGQLLDGLGAHAAGEVLAVADVQLPVKLLVHDELTRLQLGEGRPDLLQAVQLALGAVADLPHLAFATLLDLAANVGLGALGLQLGEVGLELLRPLLDLGVTLVLDVLPLDVDLVLQRRQVILSQLRVHAGDHVGREVDDLLEILRREVEQVAQTRRNTLEVPDVGDRCGQLDVAHPLATHLGASHLDTTALTDDALEADALVLTAVALPVASRSEDLLAEEAVLLRLERAVVDGLRLLDFAVRPLTDVVGRGETDPELIEEIDVQHVVASPWGSSRGSGVLSWPHRLEGGSATRAGCGTPRPGGWVIARRRPRRATRCGTG